MISGRPDDIAVYPSRNLFGRHRGALKKPAVCDPGDLGELGMGRSGAQYS